MGQAFAVAYAIIKAIPIVDQWVEKFVTFYVVTKKASMRKENRDAIAKATAEDDQRPIEQILNPSGAGQPSKVEGVEHLDAGSLPGVK